MRPFIAIICFWTVLAGVCSAQSSLHADTPRNEIISLVTATLRAWESGDQAEFLRHFGDPIVFAYPGGRLKQVDLPALFADFQKRKREIHVYIGTFLVEGNEFALQYQMAATDRVTGKRWAVGTGVRGSVANGKIVSFKEYWDEHIPEQQMAGKIPLDEGKIFPAPASITMDGTRVN